MKNYLLFVSAFMLGPVLRGQEVSRTFYPSQLKEDIRVLKEALTTLHPGLYHYNSKQQVEDLFKELTGKTAKPLNEKDFYLLLAKFTEKIGCGHTYLNPLNMEENIPPLYMPQTVLPVCFKVIDRKFIITHNLSSDSALERGAAITKINGIPAAELIDSLLQVSRADGRNAVGKKLANLELLPEQVGRYSLTDIFLPLFFKSIQGNFAVETKSIDGRTAVTNVSGVTTAQRAGVYKKRFGLVPKGEASLSVQLLNDSTCYFKVGTFGFYGESSPFTKITDSLFEGLAANAKVKNLILDLRTNEGGNTEARDALLKYVLPRNFWAKDYQERQFYSFLTVPEKLRPFLNTWDDSFYDPKPDSVFKKNELGFYEDRSVEGKSHRNFADFAIKAKRFKGNIYLLTSPVNSSAAFEFAWVFKQYKAGKIVGEKTGGTKQGLNGGRFFFLRLPYSRIEVDLPFIYQAHIGQPDEGISPDYAVSASQQGIARGGDNQLDFVLKLIRSVK